MPDVLAIVGPTASGKTSLAVQVARAIDGEIVGTDSMQAYRGMNIGTATPSLAERGDVAHHMLDCWDPGDDVSVAEFQSAARECIADILARSKVPVVTGGSGLYVSAVLDDLRFPGTDPQVRARLEAEAESVGARAMHERLAVIDPAAAREILPDNVRRTIRALEVNEITGQPFIARLPEPIDVYETLRVGLDIPRDELDSRIARRVDQMIESGLHEEVGGLNGSLGRTAGAALGYPQFLAVVEGHSTVDEARDLTIAATRRFARRQQRWFRRDERILWIPYDAADAVDRVVAAWTGTRT